VEGLRRSLLLVATCVVWMPTPSRGRALLCLGAVASASGPRRTHRRGVPRSSLLLEAPAPGACSAPGYSQLQLTASNSSLGRGCERLLHTHLLHGTHNSVDLCHNTILSRLKDSSPLDFHSFLSDRNPSPPLAILSALLWTFSSSAISFLR